MRARMDGQITVCNGHVNMSMHNAHVEVIENTSLQMVTVGFGRKRNINILPGC